MPMLDHFHPPVSDELPTWESFHASWAVVIMERLNLILPRRYKAVVQTRLGSYIEADVAEFERPIETENGAANGDTGGVAVQTWAPPVTKLVAPAIFPDDYEVQLFQQRGVCVSSPSWNSSVQVTRTVRRAVVLLRRSVPRICSAASG